MARPSGYSDEIVRQVCGRVADGRSLRSVCQDPDVPSRDTVRRWLCDQPAFREAYARACAMRADELADEVLAIADDSSRDYREGPHGPALDSDRIQRDRLRIETRKFVAARMAPKRYGDASARRDKAPAPPPPAPPADPREVGQRVARRLLGSRGG